MCAQVVSEIRVAKDGSLRIPAEVTSRAELRPGERLTLRVSRRGVAVSAWPNALDLIGRFARDTDRLLGQVGENYRMSDGLTVGQYLALDDNQREALWRQAMEEAHDATDSEPEREIPANYVPAGQEHRPRSL